MQLSLQFTGTVQQPVEDPIRAEYLRLNAHCPRCMQDLQQQLTQNKYAMLAIQRETERERAGWARDGFPGYDPKRDARLERLNEEYIRLEESTASLNAQVEDRLRLQYLKSIV